MTIPSYDKCMKPVLTYATEERNLSDAVDEVSKIFSLTDEEKNQKISGGGRTLIYDRVCWGITYLVNAKLLERPKRGHFIITQSGKEVLKDNPEFIDNKYILNDLRNSANFLTAVKT